MQNSQMLILSPFRYDHDDTVLQVAADASHILMCVCSLLQRIGDSLKKDNSKGWKTGRFGVGFNSGIHSQTIYMLALHVISH